MPAFTIETERYWAVMLAEDLNKSFNLNMATDLAMHREAAKLASLRVEEKIKFEVVGASNGARLAEVLKKRGCSVSCSATPGWRLTGQNAKVLAEKVGAMGEQDVLAGPIRTGQQLLYGPDTGRQGEAAERAR
jgi:hypothetical protein